LAPRATPVEHPSRNLEFRQSAVRAFHAAALKAGRRTTALRARASYAPNYYAAFVIDPDGNNIEAVCHSV
jgi:hypothetical protein